MRFRGPVTAASALAGAGQRSPPSGHPDRQQAGCRRIYQPSAGGPACLMTHRGPWWHGSEGAPVSRLTGRNCAREAASRSLAQVRPSNRLVTDPSLKTSWMARAMSGAIDSTVSLSKRFSGGMGSVLVTITSLIREFLR